MINKILRALGIVFIIFFVLGLIGIILFSLVGARLKTYQPARTYQPIEAPSPLALPSPFKVEFFPERNVLKEVPETSETREAPSRLVIKTGTINMVVTDIKKSIEKITTYTQEKGGWVVSSLITETEQIPSGSITVRVPAEIFDEAIAYFRELAEKVTYEDTQGQDVTEEHVDLQSRLRNLEATENQLLKIMERAGTITEILNVQRELTSIRGQIESTKGRIQYLEQSAKMATITLNLALSEELLPIPPAEKWRPIYVIKRAWSSVLASLRGISYLLIWIVIYGLIWIPLVVLIWFGRKFWKKRKQAEKT